MNSKKKKKEKNGARNKFKKVKKEQREKRKKGCTGDGHVTRKRIKNKVKEKEENY